MMRRSNGEPAQYRLSDGAVGTLMGSHGEQLVLQVSRPNWPFPRAVVVDRRDCVRIVPQPLTEHFEEARW